ncbi:MAG: lipoate--protein ligase [Phycisphaerae bacterium]|nr:lipoate--protein ligase [Phycisphaerae bacterium]
MADTIRLLIDPPLDGPTNMARDEALLQRVDHDAAPPTLRLYQWAPATVSLGYFQAFAEFHEQSAELRDMPVVRRLTGGGAIVHANELTYSLTLPHTHPLARDGAVRLYERVHDAAIDLLNARGIAAGRVRCAASTNAQRGPFLCFERRHCVDVLVGARKVLGSAQRRTARTVLQHGSLQLDGLAPVTGPDNDLADLGAAWVEALSKRHKLDFAHADWDTEALAIAATLTDKYAGNDWTQRR